MALDFGMYTGQEPFLSGIHLRHGDALLAFLKRLFLHAVAHSIAYEERYFFNGRFGFRGPFHFYFCQSLKWFTWFPAFQTVLSLASVIENGDPTARR